MRRSRWHDINGFSQTLAGIFDAEELGKRTILLNSGTALVLQHRRECNVDAAALRNSVIRLLGNIGRNLLVEVTSLLNRINFLQLLEQDDEPLAIHRRTLVRTQRSGPIQNTE